jgi:hypothetical protein
VKLDVPEPHPIARIPSKPPLKRKEKLLSWNNYTQLLTNLICKLIRTSHSWTRITTYQGNSSVFFPQRQCTVFIFQQYDTCRAQLSNMDIMVSLNINVFIGGIVVRMKCIEVGWRVFRRVLTEKVPCS